VERIVFAASVPGIRYSRNSAFIFFRLKENEPKENAQKTRPCGLPCASRSGRRAAKLAALKQSQLFHPPPAAMLGAP